MTSILSAVSKLRGCVNQIENKNPSGASEEDILNQAKMLLTQYEKYKRGFKFDHVWPILKGIEKFANDNMKTPAAFQGEGRDVTSSSSFSINTESSPSPGMNSIDLNMDSEDVNFSLSSRPMGLKKAKRKQQSEEQFKQLLEQNDKLIKAITKGTSERNKIQRQKIEVARMKEENKILFADLNSISDPSSRAYIENERKRILEKRAQTNQHEEDGEGSQYHGSQYRASHYQESPFHGKQVQGEPDQGEDQRSPNNQEDFTQYYNYLSGTGNNFP
ncbi:No apical meristem-associated C-terminal domain [Arabidopsis suecica]|uniref:No apical meristem-associated C-terminal domain n=1 Tax=Arabidopsis suecica TaxID=45249 RepID=A0A8T2H5A4_ARASU|nr:No apical meristem-associated C-terminal domain [Arabidopsis suecica]